MFIIKNICIIKQITQNLFYMYDFNLFSYCNVFQNAFLTIKNV